jgi:four helix bundle protein
LRARPCGVRARTAHSVPPLPDFRSHSPLCLAPDLLHALVVEDERCCWPQPERFRNGRDIRDRTYAFGCRVARFCERLREQGNNAGTLAPQLVRCATAPAALLEEARAAESRNDFKSKVKIALKEARESHVRLKTCLACQYGPSDQAAALTKEADEIVAILVTIVKNTIQNSVPSSKPADR